MTILIISFIIVLAILTSTIDAFHLLQPRMYSLKLRTALPVTNFYNNKFNVLHSTAITSTSSNDNTDLNKKVILMERLYSYRNSLAKGKGNDM